MNDLIAWAIAFAIFGLLINAGLFSWLMKAAVFVLFDVALPLGGMG